MARITVAKLFETVAEVDQRSQVALMQSEDSIKISEKNRIDLEKLIATLRTDFTDIEQTQEIIRSDKEEDNTIMSSFSELRKSFDSLVGTVDILRTDLDNLYEAFYTSQIKRQDLLNQEEDKVFKEEDDLQKGRGLEKEGKGVLSNMFRDKKDPNQVAQGRKKEEKSLVKGILQTLGLGALAGGAMGLGSIVDDDPTPPTGAPANVPDVSDDPDFIKEVQKLAKETGSKPSELMALYNAESGINPRSAISSGATGIFQLMYGGDFGDKRLKAQYTREQFRNLSRAEQVKAHREYLDKWGFFDDDSKLGGIADVKMANIAPAKLGQGLDDPIYERGTPEYEGNKNIDVMFGNSDGIITLREYENFVIETGRPDGFTQYDDDVTSNLPSFNNNRSNILPVSNQDNSFQSANGDGSNFFLPGANGDGSNLFPMSIDGESQEEFLKGGELDKHLEKYYNIKPGTYNPDDPNNLQSSTKGYDQAISPYAPFREDRQIESLQSDRSPNISIMNLGGEVIDGGTQVQQQRGKPRSSNIPLSNTKNGAPVASMIETKYLV